MLPNNTDTSYKQHAYFAGGLALIRLDSLGFSAGHASVWSPCRCLCCKASKQFLLVCTIYIPSRQTRTPFSDTFGLALHTMYSFPLLLTTLQESHSLLIAERTRIALWVLLDSVVHQRKIETSNGKQVMHSQELSGLDTFTDPFASAVRQGDGSLCCIVRCICGSR